MQGAGPNPDNLVTNLSPRKKPRACFAHNTCPANKAHISPGVCALGCTSSSRRTPVTRQDELWGLDDWAVKTAGVFRKTRIEVMKGVAFSTNLSRGDFPALL